MISATEIFFLTYKMEQKKFVRSFKMDTPDSLDIDEFTAVRSKTFGDPHDFLNGKDKGETFVNTWKKITKKPH